MHLQRYTRSDAFLDQAVDFLRRSPAENHLMLSLADGPPRTFAEDDYLVTLHQDDSVVGCALRTPPRGLVLTRIPTEAIALLVTDVRNTYGTIPAVFGPTRAANEFADQWSGHSTVRMQQRLFEVHSVKLPLVSGTARRADERDRDTVVTWASAFQHEAHVSPEVDYAALAHHQLTTGGVWIWEDGEPASMAWTRGIPPSAVSISLAYTPPIHRRHGYASALVAAASQRMLDAGATVCRVSADVTNATTNHIYPAIGFVAVCDMADIALI